MASKDPTGQPAPDSDEGITVDESLTVAGDESLSLAEDDAISLPATPLPAGSSATDADPVLDEKL